MISPSLYRFTKSTDLMGMHHVEKGCRRQSIGQTGYEHFRVNFVKLYEQYQLETDEATSEAIVIHLAKPVETQIIEKMDTLTLDFELISDCGTTFEPFSKASNQRKSTHATMSRIKSKMLAYTARNKISELSRIFSSKLKTASSPLSQLRPNSKSFMRHF